MRLWFRRRKRTANDLGSAREQRLRKARGVPPRGKKRASAASDDPIKNWESRDQAFLRQAGDPFLDG
jgi:hypothetical protein